MGATVPDSLYEQLFAYLDVLLKWNARTNLTAIREPEEIIRRHFGESLFTGLKLPKAKTLLDFGSGAGFPGLPIQLLRPDLMVTLAESQNKKASFLREAIRMLGLKTEVWGNRVEAMPESRRFEIVTLRAVDNMEAAVAAALPRGSRHLAILRTSRQVMPDMPGFAPEMVIPIPGSEDQQLLIATRLP
ncbi:16S rRNA (guanine(527)-N(7))-methyltransferase RsmG [Granulicella arctica]|uniref:Ribosomal RNA small subunit methyltransferase G n=1 Tax=Granulicella arctica TaxID=940613 RepID=A0A7Y9TGD7_9BACT|nr:16S rRNA (guanine(527)-N(7))-methyltransferase RsmG [Granulicella arctica]NYF78640.1 16S rRNA (guanine527-N7)-methyltransferase [Granulicella arctica]